MYFANWNGKSMVIPDQDAIEIYQNDADVQADPLNSADNKEGTGVTGPAKKNLNKLYDMQPIDSPLRYGNQYEFRVRLSDLTSGGPDVDAKEFNDGESPIAECRFKRYIAPSGLLIDNNPDNSDDKVFEDDQIVIKRPLLGYPSVLFTGKYQNAVDLLKAQVAANVQIQKQNTKNIDDWNNNPDPNKPAEPDTKPFLPLGISDPDVDSVEITVEVQTLKMDNLLSVSGKENYIKLYTTTRKFPAGFDDRLNNSFEI